MFTYFGQLLAHDTDWTPTSKPGRPCCQSRSSRSLGGSADPECFPLLTSCGDPYADAGHACFEVARSWPWCNISELFFREQVTLAVVVVVVIAAAAAVELTKSTVFYSTIRRIKVIKSLLKHPLDNKVNAVTSFVDASNVYGSDAATASALRTHSGGTLKTSGGRLLPCQEKKVEGVVRRVFVAGDERAREVPGLSALHTVFVLEHNRVARELARHLRNATDEAYYQLARAVVGAEMQNVVFGQYAEVLLGQSLLPLAARRRTDYRPHVDPSVSNAFATAAFRFGHSMIQGLVRLRSRFVSASSSARDPGGDYLLRDQEPIS